MHTRFLPFFVDPVTQEPLELVVEHRVGDWIERGCLTSSTARYPIVRGVPRFAGYSGENYADSFGYQWNRWARVQFERENIGRPMQGHTRSMWERITGVTGRLDGKVVADIGCGPGRFIDIAREKGAAVIGIDYSSAVDAAQENFKGDAEVCICQADALHLPLKVASLDAAFTIGVLHHTPDPEAGVKEITGVVKPGGWFSICVYSKNDYYDSRTVQAWRKFFKSLWPMLRHYPPLAYSYVTVYGLQRVNRIPLLGRAVRKAFPSLELADHRWSLLDTFDSVTPSWQSAHTAVEVHRWLEHAALTGIEPTNWGSTSYRGVVPDGGAAT